MNSENVQTKWGQFIPLVTVFFFWGFVAASNDILIPVFKKAFDLTQGQSQLVSVAFYVAYTIGSIIYMIISYFMKIFSFFTQTNKKYEFLLYFRFMKEFS